MTAPRFALAFDDHLQAAFAKAPDIFLEELATAVLQGQMLAEREVKERTPTSGAGTLRDSIGALPIELSGATVRGEVGTSLSYAEGIELGTRPHMPPAEPLMDWVRRKLGVPPEKVEDVAQAIRWKIFHRGTKGAFMFRDAVEAIGPQLDAIMAAAGLRALSRIEAL